jgi:heat shock protein HtpX
MVSLRLWCILGLVAAAVILAGSAIGGVWGWVLAAALSYLALLELFFKSAEFVLAEHSARELSREQAPLLFDLVQHYAAQLRMRAPKLYLIPEPSANALCAGAEFDRPVFAVTEGLLTTLNENQLRAVVIHELARIRSGEALAEGVVARIGHFLRFARLEWVWARLSVTPRSEFAADDLAAKLSGHPEHLASALAAMHKSTERFPLSNDSPATHHVWMVGPARWDERGDRLSTHEPVAVRIRRLRERAA